MRKRRTVLLVLALSLSACGSGYKERKAPCRRPALSAAFGEEPGQCGPLLSINPDRQTGAEAIETLVGN